MRFSHAALLAVAAAACSDSLDPAHLLNKPRVIAAEASVVGDLEGRTNPRPGETLRVQWRLAFPDAPLPATYVLLACAPAPTAFGVPFCADAEPLALAAELSPSSDPPTIEVTVPADYERPELLVLGGICMGGVVRTDIDPTEAEDAIEVCQGEGVGQLVSLLHPVDLDGTQTNHRPRIGEITLGGEPWTAPVPDDTSAGCAGLDLPTLPLGGDDVPIRIAMIEGSRETYMALEGDPPQPVTRVESLQNSLLITAGELDRSFSFIEGEGATTTDDIQYTPPSASDEDLEVPAEGLVVKLIVVMRDLRGGVDVASRALCVTP